MVDEAAATAAFRLRGPLFKSPVDALLCGLLAALARELPPRAVGHVKAIGRSDAGDWAGSLPVPAAEDGAHVRRLMPAPAGPALDPPQGTGPVGSRFQPRRPGEVLIEVVLVVVGCRTEHLEQALVKALETMHRGFHLELARE